MKLGLYVHIPFCLQKCTYCDFATTSWTDSSAARSYMALLRKELQWALPHLQPYQLHTIYFGGGTPSLLPPSEIQAFLGHLEQLGLSLQFLSEVTLEINPGTISSENLDLLQESGVNRFSVGTQTFQEHLWEPLGREHSVKDSIATLELLSSRSLNFTTDLLYGLPHQTLRDLEEDLAVLRDFQPPHVSTYNLTLPERHFLQRGRASDDTQVEMYFLIVEKLESMGLEPYEISNFAKPGSRSLHNQIYWQDGAYWGLGMSSHSYLPTRGSWGTRFWNTPSFTSYDRWTQALDGLSFEEAYPDKRREDLSHEQSLIDFVHTCLRQVEGFAQESLQSKFGEGALSELSAPLLRLRDRGLMDTTAGRYYLTPRGRMLLNTVLSELFT